MKGESYRQNPLVLTWTCLFYGVKITGLTNLNPAAKILCLATNLVSLN